MKLNDIIESLGFEVQTEGVKLDREVKRGYVSDLLSDVLANSEDDDLWVTLQAHPNIVAVASMKGLAGIVMINDRKPQEETVEKAQAEGLPIMVSGMSAFELSGRLYNLLGFAG